MTLCNRWCSDRLDTKDFDLCNYCQLAGITLTTVGLHWTIIKPCIKSKGWIETWIKVGLPLRYILIRDMFYMYQKKNTNKNESIIFL